eukprot:4608520-Pyramimonas_sp.AAC.1
MRAARFWILGFTLSGYVVIRVWPRFGGRSEVLYYLVPGLPSVPMESWFTRRQVLAGSFEQNVLLPASDHQSAPNVRAGPGIGAV